MCTGNTENRWQVFFMFAFRLTITQNEMRTKWNGTTACGTTHVIRIQRLDPLERVALLHPKMEAIMEYSIIFKCIPKTRNWENHLAIFDLDLRPPSSGPSVPVSLRRNLYHATYLEFLAILHWGTFIQVLLVNSREKFCSREMCFLLIYCNNDMLR